MTFYIEGKKISIDHNLIEEYESITKESPDSMQLILTVILRNALDIDNPKEIIARYSEVEIKNTLEAQLKKEIYLLS